MYVGLTPQRRDFSYPSHLTKTRDHTDLLEEYRTNVPSMTLPALPESDYEWDANSTGTAASIPDVSYMSHDKSLKLHLHLLSATGICSEYVYSFTES